MENIYTNIKVIDRISKALGLPLVRAYITDYYEGEILNYLDSLGFYEVSEDIKNKKIDYLYIDYDSAGLGVYCINSKEYIKAVYAIINIDDIDVLNMSDEELELVLRLN